MDHLNDLIEQHRVLVESPVRRRSNELRIRLLDAAIEHQLEVAEDVLRRSKSLCKLTSADLASLEEDICAINDQIEKADKA